MQIRVRHFQQRQIMTLCSPQGSHYLTSLKRYYVSQAAPGERSALPLLATV
jgi:hypothetical protein